jgi:hypothetical protein
METKNGYFVSMATKKGIDTGNSKIGRASCRERVFRAV